MAGTTDDIVEEMIRLTAADGFSLDACRTFHQKCPGAGISKKLGIKPAVDLLAATAKQQRDS